MAFFSSHHDTKKAVGKKLGVKRAPQKKVYVAHTPPSVRVGVFRGAASRGRVIVVACLLLGAVYLHMANVVAVRGTQMQVAEKELRAQKQRGEWLHTEISRLSSLDTIRARVGDLPQNVGEEEKKDAREKKVAEQEFDGGDFRVARR